MLLYDLCVAHQVDNPSVKLAKPADLVDPIANIARLPKLSALARPKIPEVVSSASLNK
jgi:hypothetical protein